MTRVGRIIYKIVMRGVVDPDDIELRGKIILFNIISILAVAILLPFSVVRVLHGYYLMGCIEFSATLFFMMLSAYHSITKHFTLPRIGGIAVTMLLFGYLTISTGYHNTGLLWSYCLPPVCVFLLDRKRGSLLLALFLLMMIACFMVPAFPAFRNYSAAIKVEYSVSFIAAWIIAYYVEYIMSSIQHKVYQKNSKLWQTIQELRETKDQLFQSQKMEAIGRLAGGIAHDFNNILSAISGYAELLQQKFGPMDPKVEKYAASILSSSKRAADLTAKLLAYARKGKIEMTIVNVNQIVEDVIDICKHTMNKNIVIRQELKDPGAMVMGDRNQLQNALTNLMLNARDAMPQGGELLFATRVIDLTEETLGFPKYMVTPGRYLKFTLTDTGTGMDALTLSRAMEPFFTTKEKGKGTGLGLASVYGTVKSHTGYFELKSALKAGTTAEIYLPLAENVEQKASETPQKIPRGNGRILLVDDEEIVRNVASEMIQMQGYSVIVSSDGKDALEYYKDHFREIDLVVLDIVMPRLGGYDCFMGMKAVNPAVKAFAFSGYVINDEVNKMLEQGAVGFVQKPFDIKSFSKAIHDALAK
jgi:signal transduction histidine kinase